MFAELHTAILNTTFMDTVLPFRSTLVSFLVLLCFGGTFSRHSWLASLSSFSSAHVPAFLAERRGYCHGVQVIR